MTVETFFNQGGYAFFVWGAYGMGVVVLSAEILLLRHRHKNSLANIQRIARLRKQEASNEGTL